VIPAVLLVFVLSFFRDPPRRLPSDPGLLVAPADGKVVELTPLEHEVFVGGPAVRIGIFLTIFNVHINRVPCHARVIDLRYQPGKFRNALVAASAAENENMWIGLETTDPPQRRMVLRQIAGAIARRIVCDLQPGDLVDRGHKLGMIKFGSRTELIVPAEGFEPLVRVGQWVHAGSDAIGRFVAVQTNSPLSASV
jgi:phosphatidylserine decarboxylase